MLASAVGPEAERLRQQLMRQQEQLARARAREEEEKRRDLERLDVGRRRQLEKLSKERHKDDVKRARELEKLRQVGGRACDAAASLWVVIFPFAYMCVLGATSWGSVMMGWHA